MKRRGAGADDASPESWGESDVSRTVTADAHRQDTPPALVAATPISRDAAAGRSGVASPGVNAPSVGVGNKGDPSFAVNASGPPSVFVSGAADVGACAVDPLPDGRRYAACGDGVAAPQAHWIAGRLKAVMEGRDPDSWWL